MITIKLHNRDGADLKLRHHSENDVWKFEVDDEHKFVLEYIRVGRNKDNTIDFIDPAGGPFISIGTELSGLKVLEILPDLSFKLSK